MENTLMTEQAATPNEGQAAEQGNAEQQQSASAESVTSEQIQQQAEQSAESPTNEAKQADEKAGDEANGKPEGAPEKYEFAPPEGVQFDNKVIDAFSEAAKDLNLSQDAAQKILDKVGPVMAAQQLEAIQAASNEWAEASKSDKEFGGDKLNENLAVAKKAMDKFASPELRSLLNESALGNNPEVIRMFYRVGMAISEDGLVVGGNARNSEQSAAQRMYPNMNP